jgi:hypothetical protein
MSGKDGRSGTSPSADPWAVPSLWVTRRLSVYAVGWCSSRCGWGEACASPRAKRCGVRLRRRMPRIMGEREGTTSRSCHTLNLN